MLFLSVLFLLFASTTAFHCVWKHSTLHRFTRSKIQARKSPVPDDVFGIDAGSSDTHQSKRRYLEEDWQLTEQENVSLEPFRQNVVALTSRRGDKIQDAEIIGENPNLKEEFPNVPMLALIYKFKSNFEDADLEEKIEARKEYCREFSNIVSDEVMATDEGQGSVTLWVGDADKGKESLQKEIDKFVSSDPFILDDIVEEWDILPIGDIPDDHLTPEEYQMYEEFKAIRKQELQDILQDNN